MQDQFNSEQAAAVTYLDGPLLVLAGAGSGKTRVITGKIAYLIEQCHYRPDRIAAITFTNKAAIEMQHRVNRLIQKQTKKVWISTFHSLGVHILRANGTALGLKPQFSILDSADTFGIMQGIIQTTDKKHILSAQSRISHWKNQGLSPSQVVAETEEDMPLIAAYRDYQRTLESYQSVDFDDLIGLPLRLFEAHPDILSNWQDRLHYLLVDEYQDTNAVQYRLMKKLAGARAAFTVVGDDNQSIYAWRGADVTNLQSLSEDYPRLKVIKLEQNYRSTGHILGAANRLIAHNSSPFEKKLWSALGPGDPVDLREMATEDTEAETIVMKILAHKCEHRSRFSDYAILYRSNHQARKFEQYLREEHVPYRVSGGTSFFERSGIKDIIAYLRLIVNAEDDASFIRAATVPRRGIGAATLEALGQYAGNRHISLFDAVFEAGFEAGVSPRQYEPLKTFCDYINRLNDRSQKEAAHLIVSDLIQAIDYESYLYNHLEPKQAEARFDNVMEFIRWLVKKSEDRVRTLSDLVQSMMLMSILDRQEKDLDVVTLSTIHAAKGLEFPHVFLVSVEEGLLPHRESADNGNIEEERRLMYVGVTRAQRTLHISWCKKRKKGQEWHQPEPSRFIPEMGMMIDTATDERTVEEKQQHRKNRLERLKSRLAETTAKSLQQLEIVEDPTA